jgi:hypothetical protein
MHLLAPTVRAVKLVGVDSRIPRPLRVLAGIGLLPVVPGPLDEVLLLLVAVPLAVLHRGPLTEAWQRAASPG